MRVVVAAIVREDEGVKRVLLVQRLPPSSSSWRLCFPGGKAGDRESLKNALLREIEEETGWLPSNAALDELRMASPLFSYTKTSVTTGQPFELTCFLVSFAGSYSYPEPNESEKIGGLLWVDADQLRALAQCGMLMPSDTDDIIEIVCQALQAYI